MSNISINWIYLQNFKGFMQLNLSFDGGQAVILGGPNGYGKTTVFDALEILYTGKIRRMGSYVSLHNNATSMDQDEQKPLVCDAKSGEDVIVRAGIQIDGKEIILERHAKVSEMRNPVDFGPFQRVFFSDNGLEGLHEIVPLELKDIGLGDIAANYDFLYYLSQEEAVAFLKTKESERSRLIQQLFDTSKYEVPIQRLGDAINQVSRLSAEYTQQKKVVDEEIKRLTTAAVKEGEDASQYVALAPNSSLPWDSEEPGFSHEDYNMWLMQGGVIDGMLYFCQNRNTFRQSNLNKAVNRLLQGDLLRQVVVYFQYKDSAILRDYKQYREVKRQFEQLNLKSLGRFTIGLPQSFIVDEVITADVLERLEAMRVNLVNLYNTTNDLGRIKADMVQRRNQLAQIVAANLQKLQTEECPLCGAKYEDSSGLMGRIETYGLQLTQSMGAINDVVVKQFEEYRQEFRMQVIEPCDAYFAANGINDELLTFYKRINGQQILRDAGLIERILGETIEYHQSKDELVTVLTKRLSEKITPIDGMVNTDWLEQIFNSYLKEIDWKNLTEEQVIGKRSYLTMLWNKKVSTVLKDKMAASARLQRCIDRSEQRKVLYRKTKKSLENQRDSYIEEIISDIKILYYIYSGRIMQDCHYGRGLLMKPDFGRRRILFVSGSYKSDVDALYNMSSGQLVSLSIAFLLALNKLYAHCPLLAIDDPVQTIDDINLWGLIETLRHDFNQHFLLLSTHEQDYSQLLTNKFLKWGIRTNLIDMGLVRKGAILN